MPSIYALSRCWTPLTWTAEVHADSGQVFLTISGSHNGSALVQLVGVHVDEAEQLLSEVQAGVTRARRQAAVLEVSPLPEAAETAAPRP